MRSLIFFKKRLVIDINCISHLETKMNNNKALNISQFISG